ncbi:hypothetical protein LAUMK13_03829 [Mycobacterium innocens]|uniref:DUF2971 domain-containing protein n=1 Tax=Mycobacterium innocens TaxID=2341083 RepID=A0A498Q9M7_9MYCO|nr:hypothetical protein LAUMK13_03829 [Mycobacterium innocens]
MPVSLSSPTPRASLGDVSDDAAAGHSAEHVTDRPVHERDGSVYHYTDIKGLKGILDSGQIWGTHVAYLNDSQEFSYGVEAICAMIARYGEHIKASGQAEPELRSSAILSVCRNMLRAQELIEDDFGPFVACFSMSADDLSQWRGYANGGYAIQFDSQILRETVQQATLPTELPIAEPVPIPELHPVEYLPDRQSEQVTRLLDDHIDELIHAVGDDTVSGIHPAQQRLVRRIIPLAASMKHKKFLGEAEQRLISHTSETFYSTSRIGLIPRVRFEFDRSAIKGVLVGPSEHCDAKTLSLYRYLRRRYPKADVVRSSVPYRDI